ncbi:MAG: zf-HC2 domain-containing protein [Candidatus Aminicenantes bacterium]
MKCKKAERLILRSMDHSLNPDEKEDLLRHLKECPLCRKKQEEYKNILGILGEQEFPEPKPYFWTRLKPRLKRDRSYESWLAWEKWGLRAIPVSLLILILFAFLVTIFIPSEQTELSRAEILLQNQNPFVDTLPLLEEGRVENENIHLIFTSINGENGTRRYFP